MSATATWRVAFWYIVDIIKRVNQSVAYSVRAIFLMGRSCWIIFARKKYLNSARKNLSSNL